MRQIIVPRFEKTEFTKQEYVSENSGVIKEKIYNYLVKYEDFSEEEIYNITQSFFNKYFYNLELINNYESLFEKIKKYIA